MKAESKKNKNHQPPQTDIFEGHFHYLSYGQLSQYLVKKELWLAEYRLVLNEQGMEREWYDL